MMESQIPAMTAIEPPLLSFERAYDPVPLHDLDVSSSPTALTGAPLPTIVADILGKKVELKRLQRSGAEGQSGCRIYFAQHDHEIVAVVKVFLPNREKGLVEELLSYKKLISIPNVPSAARPLGVGWTRDEDSGALSGVIVYEPAPGKAINTMLREVGWLSQLRTIARAAVSDEKRHEDLENFIWMHEDEIPFDWTIHNRLKTQSPSMYSNDLPAFIEFNFQQAINNLRTAVRAVAAALAKLHVARVGQWSKVGEATVESIRCRLHDWVQEILGSGKDQYERAGISLDRITELSTMVQSVTAESRREGFASLLHGDASTGNFFWHPTKGITMIDYGALCLSIDEAGRPTGPAELDTAGFYERLRKYAAGFGVSEDDVSTLQDDFWTVYGAFGVPLSDGIVRLCRLRIQMSRLWSAVAKLNKSTCISQPNHYLQSAVEFEWARLQEISGIRKTTQKRKVLVVANASGPGKGGLPLLNQELVKALSELENTSVSLFMVSPPNATPEDIERTHAQAEIFTVPFQPDCAPSELLYYAAKIHQPEEFGLPPSESKNSLTLEFDLIIGHCRYSSAAAKLVRDRWYPRSKLAIMTHTSPLRKSDAAWIWYGETREQGYVEAARLAILDEKVLPTADLAVGVGPVLTTEAREREWIGQLNQHRASESGPRFHELIPGVHVDDVVQRHRRKADDPFRILLAGRADDPAKGVEDAIYAVMKIAATGAMIHLDILGMKAQYVEAKQQEVDAITNNPGLVQIHAFSDDTLLVQGYYQTADLVIMPSTHEGFGMIFTEAAGFGIPVLATQDSGAAQFVLDEQRIPAELGEACVVMDECVYGIIPSLDSARVAMWADQIDQVRKFPDIALRHAQDLKDILRGYSWRRAAEALLKSAFDCPKDDTIQMAHGILSRSRHLAPEVAEAMKRSAKIRNASGVPEKTLADGVLQSLPEIEPTSTALEQFTSTSLGHQVTLKPLCDSHPKGFSGAPIFFAFPSESKEAQIDSSKHTLNVAEQKSLAVVKLYTHGLDNGITDELSSLEWLFHRANGDIKTPIPIAVCRMSWEGKQAGVMIYTVAPGQSLAQLMMKLGQSSPGMHRQNVLEMLKSGSQAAARALITLHTHGVEGRSSEAYLEWYYQAALDRAGRLLQHKNTLRTAGIQVDQIFERATHLIHQSRAEVRERPRTTVVHGDAHPANFFHDPPTDSLTLIDVTTLHCSLDEFGNGVGTPERDVGHFVHMLRRTGEQFGMQEDEMSECVTTFMETYRQEGKLQLKMQTLRLLVVCSAMSFLVHAARALQGAGDTTLLKRQAKILEDMFLVGVA